METIKNKKVFIGLIAITLAVVVIVVGVIYLVDKYVDVDLERVSINQEVKNDEYNFKVTSLSKEIVDGKLIAQIDIVIVANKKMKLKESDFKVNGLEPISSKNMTSSLEKDQKCEFSLFFEITSSQLQFLEYDKYEVALGNIM